MAGAGISSRQLRCSCPPSRSWKVHPRPSVSSQQLPDQGELIRVGLRVATPLLHESECLAGADGERRQRSPLGRQLRLRRVDRGDALERHHPDRRSRLVHPGLVPFRPGSTRVRPRHRGRRSLVPGDQGEDPLAGTKLDPEPRLRLHARRERSVQLQRREAGRQRPPEHHLARLARDVEDDAGGEEQRHALGELALDLDLQSVGVGRLAVGAPKEEPALVVTLRMGDADAAEDQLDQRGLMGHAERGGDRIPAERAGENVGARPEEHHRRPVVLHHGDRGRPVPDVERPVLGVAGERNRVAGEDLDLLPEAAAPRRGLELQPAHVDARSVLAPLQPGTDPLLAPVHRPGNPGSERGRNLARRERLCLGSGEDGEQRQRERETHRVTPPSRDQRIDGLLGSSAQCRHASFAWELGGNSPARQTPTSPSHEHFRARWVSPDPYSQAPIVHGDGRRIRNAQRIRSEISAGESSCAERGVLSP